MSRHDSNDPPNFDDMIAAQKAILQDELGLTWERRKAQVDVLVVDHADKAHSKLAARRTVFVYSEPM